MAEKNLSLSKIKR